MQKKSIKKSVKGFKQSTYLQQWSIFKSNQSPETFKMVAWRLILKSWSKKQIGKCVPLDFFFFQILCSLIVNLAVKIWKKLSSHHNKNVLQKMGILQSVMNIPLKFWKFFIFDIILPTVDVVTDIIHCQYLRETATK